MKENHGTFWRNTVRWMPGVLISIVALFIVFRVARWEDLGLAFKSLRPLNVALAVIISVVSLTPRALSWRLLLNRVPPFWRSYFIINEGYLLNNLFPLRLGEIGRAVFMGKASGLGMFYVLSTIVLERAFDLVFAAGLLLATLPLVLGLQSNSQMLLVILVLAVLLLGLVALFFMARYHQQVHAWVSKMGRRSAFVEKQVTPRIGSLLGGLSVLTKPGDFLIVLGLAASSWALWAAVYYIVLISFVPGAPFWWSIFISGVLSLGIAIPSAPAALGVYEAAVVGGLSLLGVDVSTALAYAILMHFMQFVITGVLGFSGLLRDGRSIGTLFADIRRQQEEQNIKAEPVE